MLTCYQCNWVVNFPLSKEKARELLDAAFQWLYLKGARAAFSKKKFLKIIDEYFEGNKLMLCRRCFLNSFLLFVPDKLKGEFKEVFINKYLL